MMSSPEIYSTKIPFYKLGRGYLLCTNKEEFLTVANNILLLLVTFREILPFISNPHFGKTWLEKQHFVIVKGRQEYLSTYIDVGTIQMEEQTWKN